jgi:hypothetical protein
LPHKPPRAWRTWGGRLNDDAFPSELLDPLYISHLVTRRRTALGLPPFEADAGGHTRRATGGARAPLLASAASALTAAAAPGGGLTRRKALHETAQDVQLAADQQGAPSGGGEGELEFGAAAAGGFGDYTTPFATHNAQELLTFSTAGTGAAGDPGGGGWMRAAAASRRLQRAAEACPGAALVGGAAASVDDDGEGAWEAAGGSALSEVMPPPPAAAAFATALATDPHTLSIQLLGAARQRGSGGGGAAAAGAAVAGAAGGGAAHVAPPPAGGSGNLSGSFAGASGGQGSFTGGTLLRGGMLWLPGEAPVPLNVDFAAEIEPALGRVLGRGGYGVVYEAEWRGQKVGGLGGEQLAGACRLILLGPCAPGWLDAGRAGGAPERHSSLVASWVRSSALPCRCPLVPPFPLPQVAVKLLAVDTDEIYEAFMKEVALSACFRWAGRWAGPACRTT